jgi:tetratricopeptide (TPR) repeat protein
VPESRSVPESLPVPESRSVPESLPVPEPDAAPKEVTAALEPGGSARSRGIPMRRGWMLGASILTLAVGAGILVGSFAAARQPGQQISGSPPVTAAPSRSQLSAQVASELLQARTLVSQSSYVAASKILAKVLEADPNQPVALAYEGWVLRLAGVSGHNSADVARGRALVAEASALDPSYPDAHVFLGYMYFQDLHNASAAVTQFKMFLDDHPLAALVKRTAAVISQAYSADQQPVPAQVADALAPKVR